MSTRKHGWRCPSCNLKMFGHACTECYYIPALEGVNKQRELDKRYAQAQEELRKKKGKVAA